MEEEEEWASFVEKYLVLTGTCDEGMVGLRFWPPLPLLLQIFQNFSGTELRTYALWKWDGASNSSFELVHEIALGTGIILARPWGNQREEDGGTHKVVLCFSDLRTAYPTHYQKFQKLLNSWKNQATGWTSLLPEAFCSCKQMPWITLAFTLGREEIGPWISTDGKTT